MFKEFFAVAIVLLMVCFETAVSQVATSAVPFLMISPNARSSAMGEAGAALANDASASFWNPAGLAFQNGSEISLSHANWLPAFQLSDMFIDYAVYRRSMPELSGTVAASITYLNLGKFNRTENSPDVLETFSAYEFAVTAGYATQLSSTFGIGVNGRYIYSRLAPFATAEEQGKGTASGFSFDVGLLYKPQSIPIPFTDLDLGGRLNIGMNVSNLGPKMTYIDEAQADPLPTNFRLGLAFKIIDDEYNQFSAVADVNKLLIRKKDNTSDPFYKAIFTSWVDRSFKEELREFVSSVGVEYWYDKFVALRAGFFYEDPQYGNRKFLTFGAGLRYDIYGFDFSYINTFEEQHPLGETLRFSLLISWGGAQ
ncbi:MAG: type IX secretion system outer membrane channel protein PorV [bacterium]